MNECRIGPGSGVRAFGFRRVGCAHPPPRYVARRTLSRHATALRAGQPEYFEFFFPVVGMLFTLELRYSLFQELIVRNQRKRLFVVLDRQRNVLHLVIPASEVGV